MPKSELVQSVLRAAELLKIVSAAPGGISLTAIAQKSKLQKSTAYNLLRTLCAADFLTKGDHNQFTLGAALLKLAAQDYDAALQSSMKKSLSDIYKKFPDDILTVSTFDRGVIRCVLRMSPELPGEIVSCSGKTFPAYISMTGLALHCYWEKFIEQHYPFEDYGADMWGNTENFRVALQETRRNGYCWKQRAGHWASAFVMPQGWVLGFSGNSTTAPSQVSIRHQAAKEFARQVWGDESVK